MNDISFFGCCLSYPDTYAASGLNLEEDREYTLRIFPEPAAALERFEMTIRPCWTRVRNGMRDTGCIFTEFPTGAEKENFTAYLNWQMERV
jgi:hypothetical protein